MSDLGHNTHGAIESSGKKGGGLIQSVAEMAQLGVNLEDLTKAMANDVAAPIAGSEVAKKVISTPGEIVQRASTMGKELPGEVKAGGGGGGEAPHGKH